MQSNFILSHGEKNDRISPQFSFFDTANRSKLELSLSIELSLWALPGVSYRGSHRASHVTAGRRSISEMPFYRGGSLLVVSPFSSRATHNATVR